MNGSIVVRENLSFHVLVDIRNPFAVWEIAIGRLRSASDISGNFAVSSFFYNKLRCAANEERHWLKREIELEKIRIAEFPEKVSRLTCVFLFGDKSLAQKARKKWQLPTTMTELAAVNFSVECGSWHDSTWIDEGSIVSDWGRLYWQGAARGADPLWEMLASGVGIVASPEVRRRCYNSASARDPYASLFLSGAASGFACGYQDVGLCTPFISYAKNKLRGSYLLQEEEFRTLDWNVISEQCRSRGFVFPVRPECQNELRTPDFSEMEFEIDTPNGMLWL